MRTSIAKKPYAFVIFQKGSGPPFPPLDPPMLCFYATVYEGCISVDFHYLFRVLGYLFCFLCKTRFQPRISSVHKPLPALIQRGDGESRSPIKNHKNIGLLSNTDLDPLKNHKSCRASIQCWAIIGTPYGISLATDNDPLIVVFGSSQKLKKQQQKNQPQSVVKVEPPLTELSGSAHALLQLFEHGNI